ncbi:hypothetical protein TL16_g05106 [Triparma laevis f. inornata]|uniref:NAD(P)-binding domain-containing protein n=1 Tax=Triparma laevis f. inornata TaxID=1714386 RepID=A0A9W7AFZ2_9STRA|nr:hypothetical protein TL16_g05106 [Triparma laevis f. inornata]
MTTTLVLGAGRATGRKVVEKLVAKQGKGDQVLFGVRSPDKYKDAISSIGGNVKASKQDVSDPEGLDFAGVDSVVFACSTSTYRGAHSVDYLGVVNSIAASNKSSVKHFVLISSRLVDPVNRWHPIRIILNLVKWKLMDHKFSGENALKSSSLSYTIIRPGGLTDSTSDLYIEAVPAEGELKGTSISRSEVADVVISSLCNSKAFGKIIEVVSREREEGEKGGGDRLKEIFV